ncbi:MAG: N-acetyltransferase [Terracoccus sp.]
MRDLQPLTAARVGDLVGRCAPCTFWLTVPNNGHGEQADAGGVLAQWVSDVTDDWGPPGRVAYVDGKPGGHVIVAPARFVPRLAAFATAPSDPATLVLVTACVTPGQRGTGLEKVLLQAAAKEALRHRARTLDAVAARPLAVARHECVLEVAPLEKLGFRVERDHPVYPRLRLDLRTTVSIKDEAAAYVSRALRRIPSLRPEPETRPDGATRMRVVSAPDAPEGRDRDRPAYDPVAVPLR